MHDMPRRQLLPYAWPLRADAVPGRVLLPESEYDKSVSVPNRQVRPLVRLLRPVAGKRVRRAARILRARSRRAVSRGYSRWPLWFLLAGCAAMPGQAWLRRHPPPPP